MIQKYIGNPMCTRVKDAINKQVKHLHPKPQTILFQSLTTVNRLTVNHNQFLHRNSIFVEMPDFIRLTTDLRNLKKLVYLKINFEQVFYTVLKVWVICAEN